MKTNTLTILWLMICLNSHAQIKAFPEAEGFGAYVTGGRGGNVIKVTTLNAAGAGSL